MLGLFSLFGRSQELKALDRALREAGLHPATVPEAVKITAVRLMKDADIGSLAVEADHDSAAMLLGYAMLGHDQFVASNGIREAERAEARLEAAIAAGDSLDARLILLALHSGLMTAEVADRLDVETG